MENKNQKERVCSVYHSTLVPLNEQGNVPICKLGTYNTHDYESNGIRFDASTQSIDSLRKDTRIFLFWLFIIIYV